MGMRRPSWLWVTLITIAVQHENADGSHHMWVGGQYLCMQRSSIKYEGCTGPLVEAKLEASSLGLSSADIGESNTGQGDEVITALDDGPEAHYTWVDGTYACTHCSRKQAEGCIGPIEVQPKMKASSHSFQASDDIGERTMGGHSGQGTVMQTGSRVAKSNHWADSCELECSTNFDKRCIVKQNSTTTFATADQAQRCINSAGKFPMHVKCPSTFGQSAGSVQCRHALIQRAGSTACATFQTVLCVCPTKDSTGCPKAACAKRAVSTNNRGDAEIKSTMATFDAQYMGWAHSSLNESKLEMEYVRWNQGNYKQFLDKRGSQMGRCALSAKEPAATSALTGAQSYKDFLLNCRLPFITSTWQENPKRSVSDWLRIPGSSKWKDCSNSNRDVQDYMAASVGLMAKTRDILNLPTHAAQLQHFVLQELQKGLGLQKQGEDVVVVVQPNPILVYDPDRPPPKHGLVVRVGVPSESAVHTEPDPPGEACACNWKKKKPESHDAQYGAFHTCSKKVYQYAAFHPLLTPNAALSELRLPKAACGFSCDAYYVVLVTTKREGSTKKLRQGARLVGEDSNVAGLSDYSDPDPLHGSWWDPTANHMEGVSSYASIESFSSLKPNPNSAEYIAEHGAPKFYQDDSSKSRGVAEQPVIMASILPCTNTYECGGVCMYNRTRNNPSVCAKVDLAVRQAVNRFRFKIVKDKVERKVKTEEKERKVKTEEKERKVKTEETEKKERKVKTEEKEKTAKAANRNAPDGFKAHSGNQKCSNQNMQQIQSLGECKKAAFVLWKISKVKKQSVTGFPSGCYFSENTAYFNTNSGGTACASHPCACKKKPAPEYKAYSGNQKCSDHMQQIQSLSECKKAARLLWGTTTAKTESETDYPAGCYKADDVWFNTNSAGEGCAKYPCACKKKTGSTQATTSPQPTSAAGGSSGPGSTQATTSPQPTSAAGDSSGPEYKAYSGNQKCSDQNMQQIQSLSECKKAARLLWGTTTAITESTPDYPAGCYKEARVWFNTNSAAQGCAKYPCACKKKPGQKMQASAQSTQLLGSSNPTNVPSSTNNVLFRKCTVQREDCIVPKDCCLGKLYASVRQHSHRPSSRCHSKKAQQSFVKQVADKLDPIKIPKV